jgi:hypothetical protein
MIEIWNYIGTQGESFRKIFEELYFDCIIDNQSLINTEYYKRSIDLNKLKKEIQSFSTSHVTKFNINFQSNYYKTNTDLAEILKEKITIDTVKLIEDTFIKPNIDTTRAVVYFDTYLKSIKKDKSRNRNDIIIKVLIAVVTATTTIFTIWLSDYYKSNDSRSRYNEIEKQFITAPMPNSL